MTVGSEVRTCYATIKSIEAELSTLAVETTDNKAKQSLEKSIQIMEEIKADLDKQLIMLINEEPQYK
ncbi:DUF1657 domain-containing protein [Virgibacillus sp. MSJ-26]|uniref:DUF1657 domain-containing protein n=1 Tax=Virgibacillus sp. MSJ-26 TaxID=2841522 RepID=UPI001C114AC0|nr:DUF1657 domain-containing protein [Virgibacillus sp. MSJ-26]MBU5467116.1 DUF1657 domain-containing protein [Virgibacillus sp. MSJ-26]